MHDTVTPSDPQLSWTLLDRYLTGECTPQETIAVQHVLTRSSSCMALIHELKTALHPSQIRTFDVTDTWAAMRKTIDTEQALEMGHETRARHVVHRAVGARAVFGWTMGIALALLVALGVTMGIRPSPRGPVDQIYTTRTGQQATITLYDGTRVALAPQSKLSVPTRFGRDTRTVHLLGEALFEVKTSDTAPFVVRTGAVSTRVLGTTFSVRRYAADDTTRIAVLSGKVVSGGRGMPLTIAAGFAAHVTDSTASETPVSNLRQYVDWTHGELIFQRTPVPVLLTTLGRWYGYQFRLIDSTMAQSDVSAVFKVSDPADMFLVLRGTLNVTMTFDGNVITLARRRDTKHAPQMPARRDVFKPSMEIGR